MRLMVVIQSKTGFTSAGSSRTNDDEVFSLWSSSESKRSSSEI